MIYNEHNHNCIYGITNKGEQIDKDFFSYDNSPIYKRDNITIIGKLSDWLDERKGLAKIYKYCPLCGKKLNKNTIKQIAEINSI